MKEQEMDIPQYSQVPWRAGDHVLHKPSGETWVVAFADEENVAPCGWPNSLAKRSDCEIVKYVHDREHYELLQELARLDDNRGVQARADLAAADEILPF